MKPSLRIIIAICLLSLMACNNKSVNDSSAANANLGFLNIKPILTQSPTKTVNVQAIDCQIITEILTSINHNSLIDEFDKADDLLKHCLPIADNAIQLQWAKQYQLAYHQFLSFWQGDDFLLDDKEFNLLNQIMYDIDYNKHYNQHDIAQLPLNVQYRIEQVKQNRLKILDSCEGEFGFINDYQAFAKLFTPHLPKDQAIFIKRLANDNQQALWCDAGISISLDELIERALFWQDYEQTYPKSVFADDAKNLYHFYEYLLFFGSENTYWLNDDKTEFFEHGTHNDKFKTNKDNFIKLAQHNSKLGKKSQAYLDFVATPKDSRDERYPIKPTALAKRNIDDRRQMNDWERATLQLMTALDITGYDTPNCIDAPICLPNADDEP